MAQVSIIATFAAHSGRLALTALLAGAAGLAACATAASPAPQAPAESPAPAAPTASPAWRGAAYAPRADGPAPSPSAMAALGRAMFFDTSLSASGRSACASCHDPAHAYGPPNGLALQRAGADGTMPGLRAAPSLRYLQTLPAFSEHHFEDEGDDSLDAGPTGGLMWDGRAATAHEQARLPLLSPSEMANATPVEVVQRLGRTAYAGEFRRVFGAHVFDDPAAAFQAALMALEVFQQTPAEFYPYSSKYDQVLRGRSRLSEREARGLRWFEDPRKGNCASCHPSARGADGAFPLFTDFGLVALGVPHHGPLPPGTDLGLCGPLRTDLAERSEYCGRFRTPTLRNAAVRARYFHNGAFASLREVLSFYVRRDSNPEGFYARRADGSVRSFDDLPARYHANVESGPPFGRGPGSAPALSEDEIDDLIAFLGTLTDSDAAAQADATADATADAARLGQNGAPQGGIDDGRLGR